MAVATPARQPPPPQQMRTVSTSGTWWPPSKSTGSVDDDLLQDLQTHAGMTGYQIPAVKGVEEGGTAGLVSFDTFQQF